MEWFDKNATALIAAGSALLSALLAGGFAILGAWLNNRQNYQGLKLKLEHEKIKENRAILLEKGEEAFTCATKWATSSRGRIIAYRRYMLGYITLGERDLVLEKNQDPDSFYRLHIIIPIYFPELHKRLNICGKHLEDAIRVGANFHPDLSDERQDVKEINEHFKKFSGALASIKGRLQKELASKVSE